MRSRDSCDRISTQLPPRQHHAGDLGGALGLLLSIAAWLAGATFWWAIAGVLLGSVIPFTLIVILPTNKQLLNPALDRRSVQTGQLFTRWGRLHAVRSVLSALALLLLLYLLIFAKS